MSKKTEKAQIRIKEIKKQLGAVGPMMPGSLSLQQRKDGNANLYGSYWKLGYTHKMKSRSHYVPEELVKVIEVQNKQYKVFKRLMEEWVDLALSIAQIELDLAKKKLKN